MTSDISSRLVDALLRNQSKFLPLLGYPLTSSNARQLDISINNKELQKYGSHESYVQSLDRINFIW